MEEDTNCTNEHEWKRTLIARINTNGRRHEFHELTLKKMELIYKEEAYKIIGACMEVHKTLGKGHNENIYKDALEIEFQKQEIPYSREKQFSVEYKGVILPTSILLILLFTTKSSWRQKQLRC